MGKYHICKWSNRYNRWAVSSVCFNDIAEAYDWKFKHYGYSTEYAVKFVYDGRII